MVAVTATGNTHRHQVPIACELATFSQQLGEAGGPGTAVSQTREQAQRTVSISAEGTQGVGSNVPALSTHMAAINTAASCFPGKLLQPPEKRLYSSDVLVWQQLSQNLPGPFLQDRGTTSHSWSAATPPSHVAKPSLSIVVPFPSWTPCSRERSACRATCSRAVSH